MRTAFAGMLVGALLLTGCGSGPPAAETPDDGVLLELGDTGGTFELRDGATLIVPDGAFDDGETLVVDYGVNPDLPVGYAPLGAPFDIRAASGDQPAIPLDLVVPYEPEGVPDGIPLEDLFGVSTLDEDTETWNPLDVGFDTTANKMTAAVTSFSIKWPWEWDWAGMAAEVSDDLGKLVGVRAGGVECTRGTEPPDWFNTTSFANNAGDAIRACVEADTKDPDVLVIELQNNRSGGQWITWDIPRVGTQGSQQADNAIAWTWSELGAASGRVDSWLSERIGTKGLYLPPLGRATIAMSEDDWVLAKFEVPDPGDVKPTIVIDALLTTIDLALGKAIAAGTGFTARKLQLRDAALTWALVECRDLISPWNAVSTPSGADLLHAAGDCLVGLEKSTVYSSLMSVEELAKFSGATKAVSTAVTIGTYVGQAGVYVADMTLFNKWEPKEYTVLARSNRTVPDTPAGLPPVPVLTQPYEVFGAASVDQGFPPQGVLASQVGRELHLQWLAEFHLPCFAGTWDGEAYSGTYTDLETLRAKALPYVDGDGEVRLRVWSEEGSLYNGGDQELSTTTLNSLRQAGAEMPTGPVASNRCLPEAAGEDPQTAGG